MQVPLLYARVGREREELSKAVAKRHGADDLTRIIEAMAERGVLADRGELFLFETLKQ